MPFALFDDYAVRYARGEHPDPVPYLERAGDHAGELARMLDAFLQWAPPPSPDEAAVTLMQAWLAGEPPNCACAGACVSMTSSASLRHSSASTWA